MTSTTEAGTFETTFPVGGGSSPLSGVVRMRYRHTAPLTGGFGVLVRGDAWIDGVYYGSSIGPTFENCVSDITAEYADFEFDLDTTRLTNGSHELVLTIGQVDPPNLLLFRHTVTFTTANGTSRLGAIAGDLFLEPAEEGEFTAVGVKCDGTPHTAPEPTGLPTIAICYYGVLPSTNDPGPSPDFAGDVLTYTAGTGDKSNDVTQYDVVCDSGETLTHLVYTRELSDCRPHFGRTGAMRTTYDADDSIFPVSLMRFNASDMTGYGVVAQVDLSAAGVLPSVPMLPQLPPFCASAAEWWDSAADWRATTLAQVTAWGGKVVAFDDETFGGTDMDERIGWAAHQSWWNAAILQWADWWRSLPCGLPVFNAARDEVELAFGNDPEDTTHPVTALLGAGTAANYAAAWRAAGYYATGYLQFALTTLYGTRGTSLWSGPTYSDYTQFPGDGSDGNQGGRFRLIQTDRMQASCARHVRTDTPNVSLFVILRHADVVWNRDGVVEVARRAPVPPVQVVAYALLPVLRGAVALRGYQGEPFYFRTAAIEPAIENPPDYPDMSLLIQYGARFERSGGYYPDAKASGDAFLRVATLIQDYTPQLLGCQVTVAPWGPGWRVGRWESTRGTLVIAVNVSGGAELVPSGLDVSGFTAAEWLDGTLRESLTVGDVPGLSVPADRVVVLSGD
jgi:hypothetical protein